MMDELQEAGTTALGRLAHADLWEPILRGAGFTPASGTSREAWEHADGRYGVLERQGTRRVMRARGTWAGRYRAPVCSVLFVILHHNGRADEARLDLLRAALGLEASNAAVALGREFLDLVRAEMSETSAAKLLRHADQADPASAGEPVQTPTVRGTHGALTLRPATDIRMVPPRWLWRDLIPAGHLTLLAGREGVGKSTLAYSLAAEVTRGGLQGDFEGKPRDVIVVASEDSWATTILPRLVAAGADVSHVFSLEHRDGSGAGGVDLPAHVEDLRQILQGRPDALVLLDPLVSRLSSRLNTHKDAGVRRALEPLVQCLEETGATALGLIHVSKAATVDPLTSVMASRAFPAVARAVLFVAIDGQEPGVRYLELVKSNLGSTTLPTKTFAITGTTVAQDGGPTIPVGRLDWGLDSTRTISDILRSEGRAVRAPSRTQGATAWLQGFLEANGGSAESAEVKAAAAEAGISEATLHRARAALDVEVETHGFPRKTHWRIAGKEESQTSDC